MIILLYGEDEFRSNRKLAEIKQKFLEKNPDAALGLFDFTENETKIDDLTLKFSSGGLFSNKKLVIIKNIFQNKLAAENREFLNFLKGERKDLIFVFWEKGKFDKKSKLAKFLLEKSKKQEFKFLDRARLRNWIIEEIKEISAGLVSINPETAEELVIFAGNNSALLSEEIKKIINYKNKGQIYKEDLELLVRLKIDTNIFKTIDAMARGEKKTTVKLLHGHLETGKDPFYLLSMYFFQFRNLLKVKSLSEKNIPEREITQKLRLHPFVVQKSLEQGQRFSLERLKELYKNLCEIDFGAKTGKIEIELALDKFAAEV